MLWRANGMHGTVLSWERLDFHGGALAWIDKANILVLQTRFDFECIIGHDLHQRLRGRNHTTQRMYRQLLHRPRNRRGET